MKENITKRITHSTFILGGSHLLVVIFNLIKNKAAAILMGTEGIGIISIFGSIIDSIRALTCLGLEQSSIKEFGNKEASKNYVSNLILRLSFLIGLMGLSICILFSNALSLYFFENNNQKTNIALLGIPIFFGSLSTGLLILTKGHGLYYNLPKINIGSGIIGSILSVIIYFLFGKEGIIYSFIIISFTLFIISYNLTKNIFKFSWDLNYNKFIANSFRIIKLGLFSVSSPIILALSLFLPFLPFQIGRAHV